MRMARRPRRSHDIMVPGTGLVNLRPVHRDGNGYVFYLPVGWVHASLDLDDPWITLEKRKDGAFILRAAPIPSP